MKTYKSLKRKRKKKKNELKEYKLNDKIRFYILNILIYIKQYNKIIILFSIIIFLLTLNLNKNRRNDLNNLVNVKQQFTRQIIAKNISINKSLIFNTKFGIYKNNSIEKMVKSNEEEALKKENNSKNMTIILQKVNNYIYLCRNNILIDGIRNASLNPKISVVTASYNSEKKIRGAIRSIQNQKMSDIEIIIVDDASNDKSLNIIENMQKEDPRIKIIKNNENMGPLYSKSIGVLYSSGKYIMQLDSDDLFINENIFNICYEEVEKNNIDILEFSGFISRYKYLNIFKTPRVPIYLRYKKDGLIVTQPKLSTFIYMKRFNKIYALTDGYLWGKCIRNRIYIKALHLLGKVVYEEKVFYGDDRIVNFILFRIANSFKYIREYGIIYYMNPNSIFNSNNAIRNCHDELINIMNIFNFTKNSSDSEIAAFEIKSRWKFLIRPGLNEENTKYARNLINQIINCKYIRRKNRIYIYRLWMNRAK